MKELDLIVELGWFLIVFRFQRSLFNYYSYNKQQNQLKIRNEKFRTVNKCDPKSNFCKLKQR